MEKLKDSPGAAGAAALGGSPGPRSGDGGAVLNPTDTFVRRHLGSNEDEVRQMLAALGAGSLEELVRETVPASIFRDAPLALAGLPADRELGEQELLAELRGIVGRNRVCRSFLGMGYHGLHHAGGHPAQHPREPRLVHPVHALPGRDLAGPPRSAAQFPDHGGDLTGLPIANASLLDEATAAAEAMTCCYALRLGRRSAVFFVAEDCHPQTIDGGADPRRGARHRGAWSAITRGVRIRGARTCSASWSNTRRPTAASSITRALHRAGPRRRRAGGRRDRSARAHPAAAAGRVRRGHRRRHRPSASACRWASAARTPPSSPPATSTSARSPAASSASRRDPAASPRCASRCRRASSTSAARRRPATSAPPRCCSPSWRRCTPSTTAPKG